MDHPLLELQRLGQSPWHDNIHRGLLTSGTLARMVRDGDVTGLTSNPTIFEQAIAKGSDYDDALATLVAAGRKAEQIVDTLVIEDIKAAADVFLPVFQRSGRRDGFVSIEVAPTLAHDTEATMREAKRLWRAVNRPNLMVKIPATRAGLPAIAEAIASGINVNVTLIFSLERHAAVMDAYMTGLERRQEAGMHLDRIASVASFFVSRIDTLVDTLLEAKIGAATGERRSQLERLRGKAAIAQAKTAYQLFRTTFAQERFTRLARDGARLQRPLWASTSTKNPAYPDVYYVDALVGPDSVNTLPPQTLAAYKDHGHPEGRIDQALEKAHQVLTELAAAGIDMAAVTAQLEDEGVAAFARSWTSLLEVVGTRREALRQQARIQLALGPAQRSVERALATLSADRVGERLARRDATLWPSADGAVPAGLGERLGWLGQAGAARAIAGAARALADAVRADGVSSVVVCGEPALLAPAVVLRRAFGLARGGCELTVVEGTEPTAVQAALRRHDPTRTAWVLVGASAEGTVPRALLHVVWPRVEAVVGDRAGAHFVALAARGSGLERAARERGFRAVVEIPADGEARCAPLSALGLVPLALLGHDLDRFVERAERMAAACGPAVPAAHNPALHLGALLGALAAAGRDKLTLVAPERLAGFAAWIGQLLAAVTAGAERPIVPVLGEALGPPALYGKDRLFVQLRLGTASDRTLATVVRAGQPAVIVKLADGFDLAAEMVRWTLAAAVACRVLGSVPAEVSAIRPLAPGIRRHLDEVTRAGGAAEAPALSPLAPDFATRVASHLAAARGRRWVALLALLHPSPKRDALLADLRKAIRKRFGVATVLGVGVRGIETVAPLLSSGSTAAVPILLTAGSGDDVQVPGEPWTLGALELAHALALADTLADHRRALLRIDLGRQPDPALAATLAAVQRPPRTTRRRSAPPKRSAHRARAAGRR